MNKFKLLLLVFSLVFSSVPGEAGGKKIKKRIPASALYNYPQLKIIIGKEKHSKSGGIIIYQMGRKPLEKKVGLSISANPYDGSDPQLYCFISKQLAKTNGFSLGELFLAINSHAIISCYLKSVNNDNATDFAVHNVLGD